MLPYAAFAHAKLRCPRCKRDEVMFRVKIVRGARHKCPRCGVTYRVKDILPIGAGKARATR